MKTFGFAWDYKTFTNRGLEASPIVVDDVIYTAGVGGHASALKADTGEEIRSFGLQVDGQAHRAARGDTVKRSVAVWKDKPVESSAPPARAGRELRKTRRDALSRWCLRCARDR